MAILVSRFIDKKQAEEEINLYLQIRDETNPKITAAIVDCSPEAKQYFSDSENSFVFERSVLEEMLKLIDNTKCNAIRAYYGASDKNEPILDIKKGSTTLVLVPAKIEVDGNGNIINVKNTLYNNTKAALQYPGGTESKTRPVDLSSDEISNKGGIR